MVGGYVVVWRNNMSGAKDPHTTQDIPPHHRTIAHKLFGMIVIISSQSWLFFMHMFLTCFVCVFLIIIAGWSLNILIGESFPFFHKRMIEK